MTLNLSITVPVTGLTEVLEYKYWILYLHFILKCEEKRKVRQTAIEGWHFLYEVLLRGTVL